jgi:hypothetical protein
MFRKLLIAFVVCGAAGGAIGYYLWNKKTDTNAGRKANMQIEAVALAQEFATDEQKSNEKYLNKIIEVNGTVTETEAGLDGLMVIVLGNSDQSVQCAMGDKVATPIKGQNVVLKGTCTGNGLMGVSLSDCYIVK